MQRILNHYPNYPTHRLYFGEVETPYTQKSDLAKNLKIQSVRRCVAWCFREYGHWPLKVDQKKSYMPISFYWLPLVIDVPSANSFDQRSDVQPHERLDIMVTQLRVPWKPLHHGMEVRWRGLNWAPIVSRGVFASTCVTSFGNFFLVHVPRQVRYNR